MCKNWAFLEDGFPKKPSAEIWGKQRADKENKCVNGGDWRTKTKDPCIRKSRSDLKLCGLTAFRENEFHNGDFG